VTSDVGMIQNQTQKIDARHYNGYLIIPGIVYHITWKLQNSLLNKRFGKPLEAGRINFIAQYGNCMQKFPFLKIHRAYCKYVAISATYINECTGNAQIIPVTMFLVTLYNVCFMFQCNKKRSNLLIMALDVFDLGATVQVDKIMNTMSEYIINDIYQSGIYDFNNMPPIQHITIILFIF
jgi:hypothetical protein